jgi:hypothetical protein
MSDLHSAESRHDPFGIPQAEDFHCGRCGHLLDGGTDEPVSTRELRKLAAAVVDAWTRWIDTRSAEWMNSPDDPDESALDDAVGDLGRVAVPERYDAP